MTSFPARKVPAKYQPRGFNIIHEDDDIIVGDKVAGLLTVGAAYEREHTVHQLLNQYVRKGNSRSKKCVYVVHRLDRETSGLLVFAKNERAQNYLKDHWKENRKLYYAVIHGRMSQKEGLISSYLVEDDKYRIHSLAESSQGKLSHTKYKTIRESARFSLLEIELVTGRKNQIRVHFSAQGHPLVGDFKYGDPATRHNRLALHAASLVLVHPSTQQPCDFHSPAPAFFASFFDRC